MNRIYKLVWNARLHACVAVSEKARGRGKQGTRAGTMTKVVAGALLALSAHDAMAANLCGSGITTISGAQAVNDNCVLGANQSLVLQSGGALVISSGGASPVTITGGSSAGSISNSGVISNNVTSPSSDPATFISSSGINVNGSTLAGGIQNSAGSISGQDGISLLSHGSMAGGISNSGLIHGSITQNTAYGSGIRVDNSTLSGGIFNSATIVGESDDGIRIVSHSTLSGGISNSGVIQGVHSGIDILRNSQVDNITNSGTITATAVAAIDIESPGTLAGRIFNSGLLSAQTGIRMRSTSIIAGGITNTGTISGVGKGVYLRYHDALSGGINNAGLVQATATSGGAIYSTNSTISGGINNLIGGTISGGSSGVLLNASTLAGGIQNTGGGTIQGGSSGIAVVQSSVTGGITSSGLVAGATKTGILVSASTVIGAIQNLSGGTIQGGASTHGGGILVENHGSISGDIINAGTVSGRDAIGVWTHSTVDGGITNSGVIAAQRNAIWIATNSAVGNGIRNSGTISAVSDGIYLQSHASVTGGIINSGTIRVTGSTGDGIFVASSTVNGGVTNTGLISTEHHGIHIGTSLLNGSIVNASGAVIQVSGGSGRLAGILVWSNASVTGGITNAGTVSAASSGIYVATSALAGSIINTGTISGIDHGIRVDYTSALAGGITNSGLIEGSAANGGIGILIRNSMVTGSIQNMAGGTITGGGTGVMLANASVRGGIANAGHISGGNYGLFIGPSTVSGGIQNSGTIVATGITGIGVHVDVGSALDGITNTGQLSGGARSLELDNTSSSFIIANSGTLGGDASIGMNTLNMNGAGSRVIGNITGTGTSVVNVNGTFTSEGTFNVGAFNVNGGGLFNWLTPLHGITAGTMTVNGGGTLNVGTSSQTLSGTYQQNSAGVYRIGLADASTSYGKLFTTNASLSNGAVVDVNIVGTPAIANGTTIQGVIRASGTLIATPSSIVVTDNSRFYNFVASTSRNPQQLDLVTVVDPGAFAGASGAANPPATGVAGVLQSMLNNGIPTGMAPVFNTLNKLNDSQFRNAVSELLPAVQGAGSQAVIGALHSMNRIIQSRVESNTGLSSGDGTPDQFLWVRGFGNEGRQDDLNGVSGFRSDTGGLLIGGDAPVTPKVRAGGAFTYANSRIRGNSDTAPNHVDVDTFELVGYASYNLDPVTDINYQVDVGRNQAHSNREITFMGTAATAEFSSLSAHAGVGIGRLMPLSERSNITPSIRLDYTRMRTDGYTESGADALNLMVAGQVFREFLATGDAKFAHQWTDTLKLVGNASIGYDMLNSQMQTTSTFTGGGAAFVTDGLAVSPWVYRAGLGLIQDQNKGVEYSLRYDVETRSSGYLNQTVSVRARWAF